MKPPSASDGHQSLRCFLALLPDPPSRTALQGLRDLHADPRGVRWLDAAALHLTLRFLGATDPPGVRYITHMLPALARELPALAARRVAIWPNRSRPRLAVLELEAPEPLQALAGECESLARKAGFEPETRTFKAHVTLARLRPGCTLDATRVQDLKVAFGSLALMASELHAAGAQYRALADAPLRTARGAT